MLSQEAYQKIYRIITLLFSSTFVAGMVNGFAAVLFPLTLLSHGMSATIIGISAAVQMATAFLLVALVPPLVTRWGIARILCIAITIQFISLALMPVEFTLWKWLLCMALFGLCGNIFFVLDRTWINYTVTEKNQGKIHGIASSVFFLGLAIGPLLSYLFGTEGVMPFLWAASLLGYCIVIHMIIARHAPVIKEGISWKMLKIIAHYPSVMLGGLAANFVMLSLFSFIILYGVAKGIPTPLAVTFVTALAVGNALLSAPLSVVIDRYHRRVVLYIASLLSCACAIIIDMVAAHYILVFIVLMIWSGLCGLIFNTGVATLSKRYKGTEQIAGTSIFISVVNTGSMLGAFSTGVAIDKLGSTGLPLVLLVVMFVFSLFMMYRLFKIYWAKRRLNHV